ncbi:MAG: NUDIX domain-containing protein [Syntrophomonadaceae bacterium]|nr:NUDIX domain-containing protein [Syntrophomonadaceae bacterium]
MTKPLRISVKVLIKNKNDGLFLKRSLNSGANAGKWDLPGGKLDPGESLEKGLYREVAEETGLAISVERVLGTTEVDLPEFKLVYLILEARSESTEVKLSPEHDAYIWIDRGEWGQIDVVPHFRPFLENAGQRKARFGKKEGKNG